MTMSSRHTTQEEDGFCVPEMNLFWCETCASTPEQKQNTLWRCYLKLVTVSSTVSRVKRVLYRHGLKATQWGKRYYSKRNIKKADYSFQVQTGIEDLHFWRHVLWPDWIENWIVWSQLPSLHFEEKEGRLQAWWHHPSCEVQHHVVGVFGCRRDWCSS